MRNSAALVLQLVIRSESFKFDVHGAETLASQLILRKTGDIGNGPKKKLIIH